MELRITQSALEDLQAIQEYYKTQDVPDIGTDFVAAIIDRVEMLLAHPESGRVVREFQLSHIREIIYPPFRVIYLLQSTEIVLIRVWRSERQLELPEHTL